jgi:amino acid transporter
MNKDRIIAPWLAVLITLNVMIGAGIFINAATLTGLVGAQGFLAYAVVGLLMVPLVLSLAQLSLLFSVEAGGLYTFAHNICGANIGRLTAGVYFFAKSFSVGILVRFFATSLLAFLAQYTTCCSFKMIFWGSIVFLIFFNLLGVRVGSIAQLVLICFKTIPILMVILSAIWVIPMGDWYGVTTLDSTFFSSMPVAFFALMGFETCLAIGHMIRGGREKISQVMCTSFLIVVFSYLIFQAAMYALLGSGLAQSKMPIGDYMLKLFSSMHAHPAIIRFFDLFVIGSVFGASYGILYTNTWNAYAVFEGLGKAGKLFMKKNASGVPVGCLLLHLGGIALSFFVTKIVILQRIAVLGIIVSYGLTVMALLVLYRRKKYHVKLPQWVPMLALCSLSVVFVRIVKDLLEAILS